MTDVHCHLQFEAFEKDFETVMQDAFDSGITRIINVGTRLESSRKAVEFAEKYKNLAAIIGVHPHHADKHDLSSDWIEQLEKLAQSKKVLAIGEIGLDYYSYMSNGIVDPKLQKTIFIEQIELANKLNLPLQIHNRHAGEDILKILESRKTLLLDSPGMFHCFAGSKDVLKRTLDLGFCIGFDGNITYKGLAPGETVSLSELAELTPLDRIVIETDSPYLTPVPFRGKRNEPKHAIITAKFISELKKISYDELASITDTNISRIFKI